MSDNQLILLLIEDQKFCIDIFKAAFPQYRVIAATTGLDGIKTYVEARPDMTFLDINLPDISGFDVLSKLHSLDADMHVVMLSSMNNESYIRKCRELGAVGFLTKPYIKENIEYYIDRYKNLTVHQSSLDRSDRNSLR